MVFWARVSPQRGSAQPGEVGANHTAPLATPHHPCPPPSEPLAVLGREPFRWLAGSGQRETGEGLCVPHKPSAAGREPGSAPPSPQVMGPEHGLLLPPQQLSGCARCRVRALPSVHPCTRR